MKNVAFLLGILIKEIHKYNRAGLNKVSARLLYL